jgi:hypothetical protein
MATKPEKIATGDRLFLACIADGMFCGDKQGRFVTMDAKTTFDREDVRDLIGTLQEWLDGTANEAGDS